MAKQILNDDVTNIAEEGLTGFALAYRRYYKKSEIITRSFTEITAGIKSRW